VRWILERGDIYGAAATGFAFTLPILLTSDEFLGSGSDILTLEYPQIAFAAEWAKRGVLPLWNPFLYNGVPFPAGVQAYFYPPSWLVLLFSVGVSIKLGIALHLALAGAGAAWLCRQRVRSRLASYVGGSVFAASGFMTAHLFAGHLHLVAAAAYIPWIVGVVDRVRRRVPVSWVLAVAGFALALLAANYQMVAIGLLGSQILPGFESFFQREHATSVRARALGGLRVMAIVGALLGAACIVAAVQLLPLARTLEFTQRHGTDTSFAASFPTVPGNLITMLVPRLFGDSGETPFVGDFSYWESFGYVGLATLALAFFAIENLPRARWGAPVATAAIGGLLALGDRTPLLRLLCTAVPPFARFRAAGRFLAIAALFAAMLAALDLDAFLADCRPKARWRGVGALVALTALVLLFLVQTTPEELSRTLSELVPVDPKILPTTWPLVLRLDWNLSPHRRDGTAAPGFRGGGPDPARRARSRSRAGGRRGSCLREDGRSVVRHDPHSVGGRRFA